MGLEARLRRLESKVIPANTQLEDEFDWDQFVSRLGLQPATVREVARSKGSSLVEATCEMLGIEPREFKSWLQEAVNLAQSI